MFAVPTLTDLDTADLPDLHRGETASMTQTAFNIANNTELSFFDWISATPDMAKLFVSYMKNVTSSEGTKIDHLVHGFAWADLGNATVVDVRSPVF